LESASVIEVSASPGNLEATMNFTDYTRFTLRGLTGVVVVIESIKSDAVADGLSESDLQADVEARLANSGIHVLNQDEWRETPGRPWLYVSVNTMRYLGSYFFSLDVQLKQDVKLPRAPGVLTSSATWEVGSIGFARCQDIGAKIRSSVDAYVTQFLTDWEAANNEPV
jgi:hypothetical protein